MSKKYSPSGYQIIHLDCVGRTSSTPFTPETEDEKLLLQILKEPLMKDRKPILLYLATSYDEFLGICVFVGNTLQLMNGSCRETIGYDAQDRLIWAEEEI